MPLQGGGRKDDGMIYVERLLLHLMLVLSSLTINRRYPRIRRRLTHRLNQFIVANGQAHFRRVKQNGGANNHVCGFY
jgi:hypothetical protein